MDLDLSEDQKMLKAMARDLLEKECPKKLVREMEDDENGHSPELWSKMVELGLLGLPFPEKYKGGGGSFLDLVVLLEETGRACLPGPFFSTVVLGGLPILAAGSEQQKQKFLPAIAQGKIFSLALVEADGGYDPASIETSATADKDSYVISGTKLFVPNAHIADYLLCLARTKKGSPKDKGLTLFIVDAKSKGISCTLLHTIAGDKQCEVIFDKVKVPKENTLGEVDKGWEVMEKTLELAAVAKCADLVGAAEQVLEMTVAYAKERIAFDHPIGSFQAIQHHCANMKVDVDGMRFLTYQAAWLLSEGLPATKEASMAKAWVSEAYRRVTGLGHQIHGSIGYTLDHDMQLYFRRGKAAEAIFGDADLHRETVACQLGL
jgi:alkylation response protein AidB-like acyl-CoA dehydrogenase